MESITPFTRKEKYINQIVGGGDTAPKTPQTREEFFFAEILGEVIAPSPVTRVEKYLSAIAGQYGGDLPTPITRIEYFLARAAGMEIETPTPITREEIFWSNYSAIVDFEVEGVPPLTYKAIEGTLENYRIFGNTVGGESVGDRTGNLFEAELVNYNISANGQISALTDFILSIAPVIAGTTYTISNNQTINVYAFYQQYPKPERYSYNSSRYVFNENSITIVAPIDGYIVVRKAASGPPIMLNEGSTALPYEPYGYKVPIAVTNSGTTSNETIYLPEPIKMVGDEAEYVDYKEQKQHRVRKSLLQNTAISRTLSTGITVTVNDNKSMVINGTSNTGNASEIVLGGNVILDKGAYILSGCPQGGSSGTYKLICIFDDDGERKVLTDIGDGATIVLNGDNPKVINNGFYIYVLSCDNNVFFPMLRKASIEDDTYEPYIENTEVDVTLPALPVLPGTNTLSVGTEVQPSNVYIKYKGAR